MYSLNLAHGSNRDPEATLGPADARTYRLQQRPHNSVGVLTVEAGVGLGRVFPLDQRSVVLGRNGECDIQIGDHDVSRRHLRIERDAVGNYQVHDLDSTNGTRVGGEEVGTHSLRDGDHIQVGNCSVLQFRHMDNRADLDALVRYRAALRDGETGAFSRAHFQWRVREEYSRARRYHELLSVVLLAPDRLDEFKTRHGDGLEHVLLRRLAEVVSRQLRDTDTLARFDSGTFAVLLRGQNEQRSFYAAERLRQIIRATAFTYRERPLDVTVSGGIASYPTGNFDDPRQLVQEALENLFSAQAAGGNTCAGLVTSDRLAG